MQGSCTTYRLNHRTRNTNRGRFSNSYQTECDTIRVFPLNSVSCFLMDTTMLHRPDCVFNGSAKTQYTCDQVRDKLPPASLSALIGMTSTA